MALAPSGNEAIQTFFGQPHYIKEVIQLLRSHKLTKIWIPPPPCLHLFDFDNSPFCERPPLPAPSLPNS